MRGKTRKTKNEESGKIQKNRKIINCGKREKQCLKRNIRKMRKNRKITKCGKREKEKKNCGKREKNTSAKNSKTAKIGSKSRFLATIINFERKKFKYVQSKVLSKLDFRDYN